MPFGGYKGSALSMMVELLSAGLIGEGWLSYTEAFFAALSGLKGARLPGDRRYAIRAKSPDTGLKIPDSLHQKILAMCDADGSGK